MEGFTTSAPPRSSLLQLRPEALFPAACAHVSVGVGRAGQLLSWTELSPPNSHAEVLTLGPQNVAVFGALKEVIKINEVIWVRPNPI